MRAGVGVTPLGDVVRMMGRHVPAALARPNAVARACHAADALPSALAREFYLECRLDGADHRVDVIAGVALQRVGMLARSIADDARALQWPSVAALCARLTDPRGDLLPLVDRLWLELDVPVCDADERVAEPGVFLHVRPTARRSLRALTRIHDRVAGASVPSAFESIVRSLPAAAVIHYVGRMYSRRDPQMVRLCIGGATDDDRFGWLNQRGGMASVDRLAHAAQIFAPDPGATSPAPGLLHVDLNPGRDARVGLEYVFERRSQARGGFADRGVLQKLVDAGLCTPQKSRDLLEWPGCSTERLDHDAAPALWARRVNHVKLTMSAEGAVAAKAYLYCAGYTRTGGALVRA
jgi:hypothetical protein